MSETTSLHSRAALLAETFLEESRSRGIWISADLRIHLTDAAGLVGMNYGTLKNRITQGTGPVLYQLGHGSNKKTVRLYDLALWLEEHRN